MKNIKTIKFAFIILPACIAVLLVIQACKKYLNVNPRGSLSETVLANKTGVEGLLIGAYHMLLGNGNWGSAPSNWVWGSTVADEGYKGSIPGDQPDINPLESWAYNTNNPYLNEKWVSNYIGVGRANETLRMMAKASDLTADDVKRITAEVRFLRGFYHFELKKVFGNIPYVDETITVANGNTNVTNIEGSGYVNIWPQIEADLKFASDNLGDNGYQSQAGRANKWAAMAYLAKVYMYQRKFTEAKALFDQIIANGKTAKGTKYALVNFFSNFNPAQDNSAESVFAVQASVNDGSGTNGNYGDNLNYPYNGGPGACCGFFNPTITLANAYKTDAGGLPLFTTYNTGNNVGAPTNAYTGTVDPRLDLTVGRAGVPFLDWGPHPGTAWVRDPSVNGWMSPKKSVYAKSQNSLVSSETSFWGPTQMDAGNVNLMRYSDVLLMAAEAEVEVGSTDKALQYVNMVRTRAADATGWVYLNSEYDAAAAKYKTQTTPAGNYLVNNYPSGAFTDKNYARVAIAFERMLELAQEGHRFFDLRRWDAGTGAMATYLNAYATIEKTRPGFYAVNQTAVFTKGKNEYFPIPQSQIDQANSYGAIVLKQNPGF